MYQSAVLSSLKATAKLVKIGNNVSLQSLVYIPTDVVIEDNVFIGPNAVLIINDPYPPHDGTNDSSKGSSKNDVKNPVIKNGACTGFKFSSLINCYFSA